MEKLVISNDHRHLMTERGKPFFWLADTAWTLPQRMKWDDLDYYMEKRLSQGFSVLQIVALDPEQDIQMRSPSGDKALHDDNPLTPNENYFRYLDYVLDRAEHYGFYVLLLPVWGQLVVGDDWGGGTYEKIITKANAYEFASWIGARYRDRTNILWCLGGDRSAIHRGVDYRPIWRSMAEGLAKGVLNQELQWNAPSKDWEKLMITYHTCYEMETGRCSTMDDFTEEDGWISFIMLQSGHGEKIKNFTYVEKEYERIPTRPVFDGEPAYEKMPTCWPPKDNELHGEGIVRRRAYWSLFSGSFGHTYGHSSVWCTISEKERSSFRPYSWYESLDHPGAVQMKYLRDLFDSRPFETLIPKQPLISHDCDDNCYLNHRQACISTDGTLAFVYLPHGGTESIDLSLLNSKELKAWWWNPRNGKCFTQENLETTVPFLSFENTKAATKFQTPDAGTEVDWVLVLEDASVDYGIPGVSIDRSSHLKKNGQEKKVFDW